MLKHEGKVVLIGIDPNDYHAPAVVYGWEEPKFKGVRLIDELPSYEKTSVRDEKGRRNAATEKKRALAAAKSHEFRDLGQRVAAIRAATMAEDAQIAATRPGISPPIVHQLDTRGPFKPDAAFHQVDPRTGELKVSNDEYEAEMTAKLEFMFPPMTMEKREASGGNR
jgi:hypothetical protein